MVCCNVSKNLYHLVLGILLTGMCGISLTAQHYESAKVTNEQSLALGETGTLFTLADTLYDRESELVREAVLLNIDKSVLNNLLENKSDSLQINIPAPDGSGTWNLQLERIKHSFKEIKLMAADENRRLEPIEYIPGLHYQGILNGSQNSKIALSLFEQEVYGLVITDRGHYDLGVYGTHGGSTYILYRSDFLTQSIPFYCEIEDDAEFQHHKIIHDDRSNLHFRFLEGCNHITVAYECDWHMYNHFGGSVASVGNYVTALHNQVMLFFDMLSIQLLISQINVWTTIDPYANFTTSAQVLPAYNSGALPHNAGLGHLLSTRPAGMGGRAYLNVLCSPALGNAFSNISTSFNNFPTYSFTLKVVAHEFGHNFGSPHTHACFWNGNNTAIDGCGPTAGYSEGCEGPLPVGGGTIMSYCNHVSGVGINYFEGFGEQPGTLMQQRVLTAYNNPFCDPASGIPLQDTIVVTACGFYELNGSYYSSSGQYNHVVNPLEGCNEILFLDLEIIPINTIFDTICIGEVFTYEDLSFNETGIFFLEAPDSPNCEGLALNLTVVDLMPEIEVLDEYVIQTTFYSGAVYEWIDCETGADLTTFASDNLLLIPGPGSYAVSVSLPGCTVLSDCFDLTISDVAGPNDPFTIDIIPNPNNGWFSLSWHNSTARSAELRIFNMAGKLVHFLPVIELNAGKGSMEMSQSQLPAGIYTAQIITDEGFINLPFVVIK